MVLCVNVMPGKCVLRQWLCTTDEHYTTRNMLFVVVKGPRGGRRSVCECIISAVRCVCVCVRFLLLFFASFLLVHLYLVSEAKTKNCQLEMPLLNVRVRIQFLLNCVRFSEPFHFVTDTVRILLFSLLCSMLDSIGKCDMPFGYCGDSIPFSSESE